MPIVSKATCLGCGCGCDDIDVVVDGGRIVEPRNSCALGVAWFGDGTVPARACIDGRDVPFEAAADAAARLLAEAERPLVYLAPELSCEAQREGIGIADALRATLDSVTSTTVMGSILAQQERGRAGATLGEIRNRADVVVLWGVDPALRYPRYPTRYAPEPAGVHVPNGRRSRTVVAVDVGEARGPADADIRVAISPVDEVATITMLRAVVANGGGGVVPGSATHEESYRGLTPKPVGDLAPTLLAGKYVVIVADAEPEEMSARSDPGRTDALIALTQALNGPTRCALSSLRAGGNRSGADAVATWQTGYPTAISFARGCPQYRPHEAAATLRAGGFDAALVIGSMSSLLPDVRGALDRLPGALIGPRASLERGAGSRIAIDTGIAGIHEAGTAIRMDDVPLPLRVSVSGPPAASMVVAELRSRIHGLLHR